jgi:hypothetical protein
MTSPRARVHTRTIVVEGYRRDDGLFDIEATMQDVRDQDVAIGGAVRQAGSALHDMWIRITIDHTMLIIEAQAETAAAPYPGTCEAIAPDYSRLAGVRIEAGWRKHLARLFAGTRGCTHITELIGNLSTVAFQTVEAAGHISGGKPRQVDGCHALTATSELVAEHFPQWHRRASAVGE